MQSVQAVLEGSGRREGAGPDVRLGSSSAQPSPSQQGAHLAGGTPGVVEWCEGWAEQKANEKLP